MDYYYLTLRLLHILGGVIWVGGGVASVYFISPTAQALKQEAAAFMKHLNYVKRYPLFLGIIGLINSISGVLLYYRLFGDSIAFDNAYGISLTMGALFALLALGMGWGMLMPAGKKLEALFNQVAAAGGPPSPEQGAQIAAMQEKLTRWAAIMTLLLLLAAIAMAANEAF